MVPSNPVSRQSRQDSDFRAKHSTHIPKSLDMDDDEDEVEIWQFQAETFLNTLVQAELIRSTSQDVDELSNSFANLVSENDVKVALFQEQQKAGVLMQVLDLGPKHEDTPTADLKSSETRDADAHLRVHTKATEHADESVASQESIGSAKRSQDASNYSKPTRDTGRSMEDIIGHCMRKVCQDHVLALGNIWVKGEGDFLTTATRYQTCKSGNDGMQYFGEKCTECTFRKGEGLPGWSWESGEAMWIDDVTKMRLDEYPRLQIAKACGVRCTFTIPFNVCGTTLAVLEFIMGEVRERDEGLIEDIRKGLQEALTMKVNGGLIKSGSQISLSSAGGSTEQDPSAYISRPLRLKAVSEQWNIKRSDFVIGKKIAEGSQGIVFHASWRGMPVAAKTLKNTHEHQEEEFYHEVSILSHLRHPNLVLFLGACLEASPVWILNEYLEGGSVEDLYSSKAQERGGRPWRPHVKVVHRWAQDLARALAFLHNCDPQIIHRDLKPSNLLLSAEGSLKVSDFGLSKIVVTQMQSGKYEMTGLTGTMRYMAPEVMESEENAKYNEKVDIYSYGLVVWSFATGEKPLEDALARSRTTQDFANIVLSGHRPDTDRILLGQLASLISDCWQSDDARRPTATKVLLSLESMKGLLVDGKKAAARPKGQQGGKCSIQ